jgi:hypothetical protein
MAARSATIAASTLTIPIIFATTRSSAQRFYTGRKTWVDFLVDQSRPNSCLVGPPPRLLHPSNPAFYIGFDALVDGGPPRHLRHLGGRLRSSSWNSAFRYLKLEVGYLTRLAIQISDMISRQLFFATKNFSLRISYLPVHDSCPAQRFTLGLIYW